MQRLLPLGPLFYIELGKVAGGAGVGVGQGCVHSGVTAAASAVVGGEKPGMPVLGPVEC